MAGIYGGDGGLILEDSTTTQRNLTSYLTNIDFSQVADSFDTTTFNTSTNAKTYVPGNKDATFSISGMWGPTVDGYINGVVGVEKGYTYFVSTTDSTNTNFTRYTGNGIITAYSGATPVDGALTFTADIQNTGTISRSTAST